MVLVALKAHAEMANADVSARAAALCAWPRDADQRREGPLEAALRAHPRDSAEHEAYGAAAAPPVAQGKYGVSRYGATCPLKSDLEPYDDAFARPFLRRSHRHSMVQVPAGRAVARRSELLESWRTYHKSGTGNAISLQAQVAGERHRRGRIRLVRRAHADPRRLGVLSTGERRCESRGPSRSHRGESQGDDRRQR